MPELPEVETVRRQLQKVLVGQTITEVQIFKDKSFHGDPKSIIGSRIIGTRRFGKALVIDLRNSPPYEGGVRGGHPNLNKNNSGQLSNVNSQMSLVIHLKMTGQLIYESHESRDKSQENWATHLHQRRIAGGHPTADFVSSLPSKHTRVIFHLTAKNHQLKAKSYKLKANATLFFNDQRIFGWIKLVPTGQVAKLPFIDKLGLEPASISQNDWVKIFQSTKKPVKLRLMDQDKIAGLGNIYANDALWLAGIHPERPSNSLKPAELNKLHTASVEALNEGIQHGGATAADGKYIDLAGLGGKYQDHFKTYQREGKPCLRNDGGLIVKQKIGGRSTFYCPECQK